jgi:high-affinity Fe2+/Pb2+ permease
MKKTHYNQYGIIHLLILIVIVVVVAGGWWWVKHHKAVTVNSFDTCAKSGRPIQTSYPAVCITKDGKRFVQSITHSNN